MEGTKTFSYIKKNVSVSIGLSLFVLVWLSGLLIIYSDFFLPVQALGNQIYQAVLSGGMISAYLPAIFLSFLLLFAMVTITYVIFGSAFWYILKNPGKSWLPGFPLINFFILALFSFLFLYVLSFILPGILVDFLTFIFFSLGSIVVFSNLSQKYVSTLKKFFLQSALWILLLFLFLTFHFILSTLIYFVIRIDPYDTFWGIILQMLQAIIYLVIFQGITHAHAHNSFFKGFNSRKQLQIIFLSVICIYIFIRFLLFFSYTLSVASLFIIFPLGVVFYSLYLYHENKN